MSNTVLHQSLRVLLVDDDRMLRQISAGKLDKIFYNVDSAENGQEAIQKCKEFYYNLIFMDIEMPEMNGYEATKKIRENEAAQKQKSIIVALSGHITSKAILDQCIGSGMDDCLVKPLDIEVVKNRLAHW